MLADDATQRSQRHLNDGVVDAGHFDHRPARIDDALPDDGLNLDRNVVARDGLLRLDRGGLGTQVLRYLPLDHRQQEVNAGSDRAIVPAQPKYHRALVLRRDRRLMMTNGMARMTATIRIVVTKELAMTGLPVERHPRLQLRWGIVGPPVLRGTHGSHVPASIDAARQSGCSGPNSRANE